MSSIPTTDLTDGKSELDDLLKQAKELRARSRYIYRLYLTQHWRPLHRRPISDITRHDVLPMLSEMARERGDVALDPLLRGPLLGLAGGDQLLQRGDELGVVVVVAEIAVAVRIGPDADIGLPERVRRAVLAHLAASFFMVDGATVEDNTVAEDPELAAGDRLDRVAALRERREDLPLFIDHFLDRLAEVAALSWEARDVDTWEDYEALVGRP